MTTVSIPADITATEGVVEIPIEHIDGTNPFSVTDTQLSQVWKRPEKKIRKRLKRLAKRHAKGKNVDKDLEKFFKWVMKKGMRPEILAQIHTNW